MCAYDVGLCAWYVNCLRWAARCGVDWLVARVVLRLFGCDSWRLARAGFGKLVSVVGLKDLEAISAPSAGFIFEVSR
jgi:hypothetical protein